jgi:hypothetical protein
MMKCVIYFRTDDKEKIERIKKRFGMSRYMSVNFKCPANIKDEDIPLLKETEKRGFISIIKSI